MTLELHVASFPPRGSRFSAADVCFGAATLTEWAAAAHDPQHFRFVVACQRNEKWRFDEYTPEQFMAFSSVPPFKIYFSVPLNVCDDSADLFDKESAEVTGRNSTSCAR
jgi:hypothetical protein